MGIVLDPTKCFPVHPTEEILEEFVFHHLPEPLAAQVEEHLLISPACQDALAETEEFVSAMKLAAEHPDSARDSAPRSVRNWSLTPAFVLALLALLVVLRHPHELPAPVAVSLSSLRGFDPLAPAPAGKPLDLSIDSPDLGPGRQYRVELVDSAGAPVWKGAVTEADGKLVAHMPEPLRTGVYWVRLYGADQELLREFGLSAR